jgi:hypothetical protein
MVNSVFKSFIFGFLVGVILVGIGWVFVGRNDIGQIRQDYNRVNGDFQGVQRNSNKLTADSSGFAGDIAIIAETSRSIENRSIRLDKGLTDIDGDIGLSVVKVDELEQYNIRLIRIGRNLGDISYDLRQLNKESRAQE